MLIDFHTHAFPEAIAPRAVQKLAHDAGGLDPQTDGTLAPPSLGNAAAELPGSEPGGTG